MRQVLSFVPLAALPDHREIWRSPIQFRTLPLRHLQVQRRQVAARQVIPQVRRRQPNLSPVHSHFTKVYSSSLAPLGR